MSVKYISIFIGIATIFYLSCSNTNEYKHNFPEYFPHLDIPQNNLLTTEKIKLGELLFNDPSLSIDSTIMCASCHKRDLAFADSVSISPGVGGRTGDRNSPSLINAAFSPLINKDGGVTKLDIQALIPIEDHNEMGISIIELTKRLAGHDTYESLFLDAFNRKADGYTIPRAFASYIRSLIDANSVYDDFLNGNSTALSESAQRGRELFFSSKLKCGQCHSGALLTDFRFENNGLHEDYKDLGRALITLNKSDHGKFRIPSLRNVALTAPYMHDGSLSTLDQVIDHYASAGSSHPNKSDLIKGFELDNGQRQDLIEFLNSLTSRDLNSY